MGISRQSMYDTFGDKRQLYLEALQHYNADGVADLIGADVQVRPAAQFMASTIFGLKVSARGGASPETLRGIARMAIRSLR